MCSRPRRDPTCRERFKEQIDRDGVVHDLEYQVRQRNGNMIWISENARAVRDEFGEIRFYEGFIDNITARAFYALSDTQTPMKISAFCLVLNVVFGYRPGHKMPAR